MPVTISTQKQADKIYIQRAEQYHKIKDTYGPTITPDLHQMSLIPKTASDPRLLTKNIKSGTRKKIKHNPGTHEAPKSVADPHDTISGTQKSVSDPPDLPNTTLETPKSTAQTHENNKTELILGSIIVGSVVLLIYVAAYNNPAISTTRAHILLPNQFTTLSVAEISQDTMDQ